MKSQINRLGEFIEEVNIRNADLKVKKLIGVSMEKTFIPSVANVVGTDMSVYKIIKKRQFACKLMSVGRDEKLPVDLYVDDDEAIVSSAYYVFQVKDEEKVLPEYLMMWLSRPESDRYIGFISGSDVRGGISWETFCDLPILVPAISDQREVVRQFQVVNNRIAHNHKIIITLTSLLDAIYKKWFVDFEFPDACEAPYKSSGGQMVWNEEFEGEIPKDWKYLRVADIASIKAGGDKPKNFSEIKNDSLCVPVYSNSSENEGLFGFTDTSVISHPSITISARGAIIGYTALRTKPFVPVVRLIVVSPKETRDLNFIFCAMQGWKYDDSGSAQGQLTIPDISIRKLLYPNLDILKKFEKISSILLKKIELKKEENLNLKNMSNLLLSRLTKIC